MKITVIGASGQIGAKVVEFLTAAGQDVVAAARNTGVDVLTGEGLDTALAGADVLVDVVNSPSFEDDPVMSFFSTSSKNLVAAAKAASVGHYVALSIVGVDGIPDSGYMRAKVAQERTIAESGLPYTIVRATQFHEFAEMIVGSLMVGDEIHVPDARIQTIAAAEVSAEVAKAAQGKPVGGVIDIGGPEKLSFAELAQTLVDARGEHTPVVVDPAATYFGAAVNQDSLVTQTEDAVISPIRFADWLKARG